MAYFVYNILLIIAFPFILLILIAKPRCRHGLLQRLGRLPLTLKTLDSPLLWVHAVSLGEVIAVVPLVKRLHQQYPEWNLIVSTVTETGREAVEQQLAGVAQHCYCPLDFPWAVDAYIRRLRPLAFLFVETELWPNLLKGFARQDIPTILVNGRISSDSFQRYQYVQSFMTQVLSTVTLSLMQSERDARRLIELGADPETVHASGNMKFDHLSDESDNSPSPVPYSVLGLSENEKVLIAGSTHSEEEEQLLRCYKRLSKSVPSLVLLLAPRHIERTQHVEEQVLSQGLQCARKSHLAGTDEVEIDRNRPRVIILDTRGELSSMYSLGWIAFVGGTLIPIGGHNLLEPARWGVPVFFGPYTDHCSEIAQLLCEAGGGIKVHDEHDLFESIMHAYQHSSWTQEAGLAAQQVVQAHRGVVSKNIEYISDVLHTRHAKVRKSSLSNSSLSLS